MRRRGNQPVQTTGQRLLSRQHWFWSFLIYHFKISRAPHFQVRSPTSGMNEFLNCLPDESSVPFDSFHISNFVDFTCVGTYIGFPAIKFKETSQFGTMIYCDHRQNWLNVDNTPFQRGILWVMYHHLKNALTGRPKYMHGYVSWYSLQLFKFQSCYFVVLNFYAAFLFSERGTILCRLSNCEWWCVLITQWIYFVWAILHFS